ncbi:unnamed protein product [Adineta steineri]|uniref:SAP domain-containing protein n=1 Tax=Adineta steineri TaxID=433720 RepID=A0A813W5Y1_9BILA|nr:unnamed protein product [Adineta steineri]
MAEAQLTNQLTRIDSMTNVELRAELKRRGCPTSGNKKDLLAKLRVALQKEFEQASLEAASTTSTTDSMSLDGRNNNLSGIQQSPIAQYDINRSSLNNSSNNYMTPDSGSPVVYSQQIQGAEAPLTYTNLQLHDQAAGQYAPVYNLTMHQNAHQPSAPMIPVPQQLTIAPAEIHPMYNQSLLQNQQHQQQQQHHHQHVSPMNTRQQRKSVDVPANTSITPTVLTPSPERKPRTRSKKSSVDSQSNDIQQPISYNPPVENLPIEIINPTADLPTINIEQPVDNSSANVNNGNNNIEVNPFVSKSNEEEPKDIEKVREERGDSRSPSVDSSSAKSESVIKEIPLSGDRHRLSRSKSPKSRWHHSPSPATTEEEQKSAITITNDDKDTTNEQVEKSSTVTLFAEEMGDLTEDEKKQDQSSVKKTQETTKNEEVSSINNQQAEKPAPQQQLKPSRSQTSSSSSSSASLMKGINRSTTSNRMNLSSDMLKTLIPDISLAPESSVTDELEASTNEHDNNDDNEQSSNQAMLETSVGNGFLLSDSMTIGDLADQKQQRNRTVVIDVAVDSSSLNDDLIGNGSDIRKKTPTSAPFARVTSFESKTLLDGKTNALMMDEPVRVKDPTETLEPPSRILYIRGLTRPFTLPLLKELLSRFGTLVDGEFWLDKIKSQCFVTYTTLEEAQNAREGLDGCRWPSTNPKTLSVRFGRQNEFEFSKSHDLPPDQMSIDAMDTTNNRLIQEKSNNTNNKTSTSLRRSASPNNETKINNKKIRPSGNNDVREWDLPKFHQEKEKSPTERNVIEEPTVKSNEPPAKGLDDYFRKTKAKPAIYWLPLTEEQILERTRRHEQRTAERDEEQRKRQLDETARVSNSNKDSKSRSNNNDNTSSNRSHRRSPSPREKRRRVSSSNVSSPRRDTKRH